MLDLCTVRSAWFVTLSNCHCPSFCLMEGRQEETHRQDTAYIPLPTSFTVPNIQSSFSFFTFILDWNNGRAFHGKHHVCPQYPQAYRTNKLCPEYLFLSVEHLVHLGYGFPRCQGQHWTPDGQSKLLKTSPQNPVFSELNCRLPLVFCSGHLDSKKAGMVAWLSSPAITTQIL